jgi:hypothetical protein
MKKLLLNALKIGICQSILNIIGFKIMIKKFKKRHLKSWRAYRRWCFENESTYYFVLEARPEGGWQYKMLRQVI